MTVRCPKRTYLIGEEELKAMDGMKKSPAKHDQTANGLAEWKAFYTCSNRLENVSNDVTFASYKDELWGYGV